MANRALRAPARGWASSEGWASLNILIVNAHSALNLGDDAILQATLRSLRAAFPGSPILVAANDPHSYRRYPGLEVVGSFAAWIAQVSGGRWRGAGARVPLYATLLASSAAAFRLLGWRVSFGGKEQRRLLAAYYDADLVLSCGGGYFFAHRPLKPFFLLSLAAIAFPLALGKRVAMLPQSVGPIEDRVQRFLARLTFERVRPIMARESLSADFVARRLGIRARPPVLPDLALTFRADAEAPPRGRQHGGVPRIGVTAMDHGAQHHRFPGQARYEAALAAALARLVDRYGAHVEICCQCYGPTWDQDDRAASRRLRDRLLALGIHATLRDEFTDPWQIAGAYGELDLLIGTRMHSAILALCSLVPSILIGYQPKAVGTMALLGLGHFCRDIGTVTADELFDLAREILDDPAAARAAVATGVSAARSQLDGWVRWLEG